MGMGAHAAILLLIASFAKAEPKVLQPALVIQATTTVSAMADRRYIFGLRPGHVQVWSAMTGQLIADAPGDSAALDNRSEIAIVGSEIWDLHNRKKLEAPGGVGGIVGFTPDGQYAITGRNEIQIWSLKLHAVVGRITAGSPRFVAVADNLKFIAIGRGEQFDVYDMKTGQLLTTGALAGVWPFRLNPTKGFSEFVNKHAVNFSVVYEQAGDSPGRDGAQPLYQVDWESRKSNLFAKPRVSATGLSAQPNGKDVVLSLSYDPAAEHAKLTGHSGRVSQIAFSPDRWTVATGDTLGEVRVWNVFAGEQLSQFRVEGGTVTSLGFSPDAQFLLAGTHSEMRVYAISP